jgi:hypothetical protein
MSEDQAKQRFMLLQLTRLVALGLVMAGIANIGGKFLPDLAPVMGYALLIFGAVDFFALPMLLKRVWQKQDQ